MKTLRKVLAALVLVGSSTHALQADECCYVEPDCCYEDCCNACVSPYVALGAIAVVAIIAVCASNPGGHHGHGHSHF